MSSKKAKVVGGDDARLLTGERMSDLEVSRYNELKLASNSRNLSSPEGEELFRLNQKNQKRVRF
jgi:hypothetical protein